MSDKSSDRNAVFAETEAKLARAATIQLTAEQFEKLYLQPGGKQAAGDASRRFGNPTPLGLSSFLVCLAPMACMLMQFRSTDPSSAVVLSGAFYYVGGVGMWIAGLGEFLLGNTFPFTVFANFGSFFLAFGYLNQPTQQIAGAYAGGASAMQYNGGIAIYLVWWTVLHVIYLVAALRTNVVFVIIFIFQILTLSFLSSAYYALADSNAVLAATLFRSGGACAFVSSMLGWYLLAALIWASTGIPICLPVGDLSGFLTKKQKSTLH